MSKISDTKNAVISSYLKDPGPLKSAIGNCALVASSQIVLEGRRGPSDLKDQVITMIYLAGDPDESASFWNI
jgi:hypothetical protein